MGPVHTDPESLKGSQENRAANCALGLSSVMRTKAALRPDARVAIVGYGPSLNETWKDITENFDAIWTVSKALDFLVGRAVPVTHHTDTDWRAHKAKFNRPVAWAKVDYYLASQVHPSYLDNLKPWTRVALFHVVQDYGGFYDPRYLRQPAMFDAGLQAAQLAYWLGYREQEWFGMDASVRDDKMHAGPHEGTVHDRVELEVAGKPWVFSSLSIRSAMFAEKLLCRHPQLKVKIHGDGALRPMLQERGKCKVL